MHGSIFTLFAKFPALRLSSIPDYNLFVVYLRFKERKDFDNRNGFFHWTFYPPIFIVFFLFFFRTFLCPFYESCNAKFLNPFQQQSFFCDCDKTTLFPFYFLFLFSAFYIAELFNFNVSRHTVSNYLHLLLYYNWMDGTNSHSHFVSFFFHVPCFNMQELHASKNTN